jgi:hypothetical protein
VLMATRRMPHTTVVADANAGTPRLLIPNPPRARQPRPRSATLFAASRTAVGGAYLMRTGCGAARAT